jgi:hypothetical protein
MVLMGAAPAGAALDGPQVTLSDDSTSWRERAAILMDHRSLGPALRSEGYWWEGNAEIYVAEIVPGVDQPALLLFDTGQGAFSQDFWPASAVKLLAAVAALEFADAQGGYTGESRVTGSLFGDRTIRSIYEPAIVRSDNFSFDLLIKMTGLDYINREFAPSHGLDTVTIGTALTELDPRVSPAYELSGWVPTDHIVFPHPPQILSLPLKASVPARGASRAYRSNNIDLFDLGEVVRRVMLDGEIPDEHRFTIAAADLSALTGALCSSSPAHYRQGATAVFGEDVSVCGKAGWWERTADPDDENEEPTPPTCTDVSLISDPGSGRRVLIAATGGCSGGGLALLAAPALRAVAALDGTPLQTDDGVPMEVSLGAAEGVLTVAIDTAADWALVSVDGGPVVTASGDDGRLQATLDLPGYGSHLLVIRGFSDGAPIAYRAVDFEVSDS